MPGTRDIRKLVATKAAPDSCGKFPVLLSYFYMRKLPDEKVRWIVENQNVEILIDSGGFSALNVGEEVDLGEYMDWLKKWGDHLFGYVALDKLGDPAESDKRLQVMLKEGLKPVPVHVRGDDEARMDQLFGWSDWVALGGFRRPHRGWSATDYVKEKMHWAKGRNVHWLGYTRSDMVLGFRPYSCDSSNQAAGRIWGQCQVYRGLGKIQSGRFDDWRKRAFDPQLARLLESCNFTRSDFLNRRYWRSTGTALDRFVPNEVSIASWCLYTREMRRRTGTRYFQATTPTFTGRLFYWIDKTLPEGQTPYLVDGQHPDWAQ